MWGYNQQKILTCKSKTKQLFSVVNSITNNRLSNPIPKIKSNVAIADDFADFFIEEIQNTRDQFASVGEFKLQTNAIPPLKYFLPLTTEEVQQEIMSMKATAKNLSSFPENYSRQGCHPVLKQ